MKKRRYSTKALSLLLAVMLVLNVFVPAVGAAGTDTNTADRLTPDEMTFRKVWTQRNVFNTELLLDEADLPDGGWTVGGGEEVSEVKEIGTHTPYGMYDITVSEQEMGTTAGLLLKKDDQNYITIEQSREALQTEAEIFSTDFSDADYYASLAQYKDDGQQLTITRTENGTVRFAGVAAGRGECFVSLTDCVRQGIRYEVDVTAHNGASYNNMIFKLRSKDGLDNTWFVQRVGNGTCTLDGRYGGVGGTMTKVGTTLASSNPGGIPYTMSMEIKGKSIVFSRKHGDVVDFSTTVDMSPDFDLTDPEILANLEVCVGGRMDNNHNLEIGAFRMYDCRTEMDFEDADLLVVHPVTHYSAQPLNVSADANGLSFTGNTAGRGESFVELGTARMGAKYTATVGTHSGSYNNQCIYIDYPAGELYFVNRTNGQCMVSCSSDSKFSHVFSNTGVAAPYTVSVEFTETGAIFTQEKDGVARYSQYIDLSPIMDLTDPLVCATTTVNVGGRMDPGAALTYTSLDIDWNNESVQGGNSFSFDMGSADLLDEHPVEHWESAQITVTNSADGLRFTNSSGARAESYVKVAALEQGAKYAVTVSEQSSGYTNQCISLTNGDNIKFFFTQRYGGTCTLSALINGAVPVDMTFSQTHPGFPFTQCIEVQGKNLIFSQVKDGVTLFSQTVDVSQYLDLTDPEVLENTFVKIGGRIDNGKTINYSAVDVTFGDEDENKEDEIITGELVIKSYVDGKLAMSRVLRSGEFTLPYTIRADFSAKTELKAANYTGIGYVNVWVVEDGKATLVNNGRHDIDVMTDFSNPEVTEAYTAYVQATAQAGSSVTVHEAKHCLTGGAGQADPKVVHDEKGQVIIEDNKVWLAMSTRGYSNRSSYQGLYCLDLETYDLDLVGTISFNICPDGVTRYAQNHASDIIYNSMTDEWIVYCGCDVNTAQIFCGLLPGDPREGGFIFVDVEHVQYEGSTNGEEDPSLIYDEEAGKWRLVMCNSQPGTGYQIPLYESDTWNGDFKEIARYATGPCTGNLIRMVDGKFYVFSGRGTDNMEAIAYPEMTKIASLNVESSPKSYNVWPSILPVPNEETGETRYFLLTFDREQHSVASNYSSHNYGNLYLYESVQVAGKPAPAKDAAVENFHPIVDGKITSAQQLAQIRNDLSGNYVLAADIDLSQVENWVPIGTEAEPFTGTFDGNGHIISGLNSDRENANAVGLFGSIAAGATVKNVAVVNSSVKGYTYVGLLAGKNYGVITDCMADGTAEGFSAVGGLVGQNNGKISNSNTSGTVIGTGGDSIGGFVGVNTANIGTVDLANKGVITGCASDAAVTGYVNVGGFVGQNDCGTISNCFAQGNVDGVTFVGGFAGRSGISYGNSSKAPITNCYATGVVKAQHHAGGFAGYNDGNLTQCFADGAVAAQETVGGLIGWNNNHAIVSLCYSGCSMTSGIAMGLLIGENYGTVKHSAAPGLTDVFGNSPLTVMDAEAPALNTAAVYRDRLIGYNTSTWSISENAYPQLTTLPVFRTEVDTVEAVIAQIDSIVTEELTMDSKEMMEAIRENYDDLTEEEKEQVTNYDKLLQAEQAMAEIIANDPTEQAKAAAEAARAAQVAAEAAKADAEAAQKAAETAQAAAEEAAKNAGEDAAAAEAAKTAAENAKAAAETAQKKAEAAQTAAENAQKAAAQSDANAAQSAANAAADAAAAAKSAGESAASASEAAQAASAAQSAQKAAEDAKAAAEAAKTKAEAAQAAAEEAEKNAGEDAAAAAAAKTAAETAQALAEAAQDQAEAAQAAAEEAMDAAEESAAAAANSNIKAAAEAAKAAVLAADAAKDAVKAAKSAEESAGYAAAAARSAQNAQAAQKAAEEAKAAAEAAKAAAEAEKAAAENAKDDAEAAQSAAQAAQSAAEAAKAAAEAEKLAAEAAKQAAADAQALAEAAQVAAREDQLSAQAAREAAEAAQKAAEEAKAAVEAEKLAVEEERRAAEEAKAAAEAAQAAAGENTLKGAKVQAALNLDSYAQKLCQTEYLNEIVAAAKEAIENAETTEEVQEILAQAKADMDGVAELCPSAGFADVDGGAWYHDYVDYMIENGYMNGISATEFDANGSVTRAQLVTILYRTAGEPSVEDLDNPFEDVEADAWYTDAIIWAANEGIVKGMTETTFEPAAAISREQIVTILHRYAGEELVEEDYLTAYTDADSISGYAYDAMNWAIAEGVINGMTRTTLAPAETATRAQICAIVMRYLEQ